MNYLVLLFLLLVKFNADPLAEYQEIFQRMDKQLKPEADLKSETAKSALEVKELQVATINTGLVLLLHPKMLNYHFGINTFLKEELPNNKLDKRLSVKSAHDAYIDYQKQSKNKQKELDKAKEKLIRDYENLRYEQLAKMAEVSEEYANNQQKLSLELKKQEDYFFEQKIAIEKNVAQLEKEFNLWRDQVTKDIWLTEAERNERLKEIALEIKEELAMLAQEKGVIAILKQEFKAQNKFSIPFNIKNLPIAGLELNPLKTLTDGRLALDHDNNLRPEQISQVRLDYLNQFDLFLNLLTDFQNETFGLQKDLTKPLLLKLWQKYEMEPEKIAVLAKTLRLLTGEE